MGRFVRPETVTLKISQGDTLVVKKRLNTGERRAMFAAMAQQTDDGDLRLNRLKVGIATILAFLVDWSLRDDDGKPVVILNKSADDVTAILDALDTDSFKEILDAIETHERAMTAEREAEKKTDAPNESETMPVSVAS